MVRRQELETTKDPERRAVLEEVLAALAEKQRGAEELESRLNIQRPCPVCGGTLAMVGQIEDDQSKPSKNVDVWNRSFCANFGYQPASPICTACWFAQSYSSGAWERSSVDADSFVHPLEQRIREVPLPPPREIKALVVYQQRREKERVAESVSFRCKDLAARIDALRGYCDHHGLSLDTRAF